MEECGGAQIRIVTGARVTWKGMARIGSEIYAQFHLAGGWRVT